MRPPFSGPWRVARIENLSARSSSAIAGETQPPPCPSVAAAWGAGASRPASGSLGLFGGGASSAVQRGLKDWPVAVRGVDRLHVGCAGAVGRAGGRAACRPQRKARNHGRASLLDFRQKPCRGRSPRCCQATPSFVVVSSTSTRRAVGLGGGGGGGESRGGGGGVEGGGGGGGEGEGRGRRGGCGGGVGRGRARRGEGGGEEEGEVGGEGGGGGGGGGRGGGGGEGEGGEAEEKGGGEEERGEERGGEEEGKEGRGGGRGGKGGRKGEGEGRGERRGRGKGGGGRGGGGGGGGRIVLVLETTTNEGVAWQHLEAAGTGFWRKSSNEARPRFLALRCGLQAGPAPGPPIRPQRRRREDDRHHAAATGGLAAPARADRRGAAAEDVDEPDAGRRPPAPHAAGRGSARGAAVLARDGARPGERAEDLDPRDHADGRVKGRIYYFSSEENKRTFLAAHAVPARAVRAAEGVSYY